MEKVWEELRKIESEAEHIHSETLKKSEELIDRAKKDAEQLLSVSKKHTETEANKLLTKYLEEAANEHDASLEANEKTLKELRKTVETCFDKAVNTVFDAVLGTIKV
jgi:F0F1-type ATP synthase membrane subunit b/b'